MKVDRRKFLGTTALGGGAMLASALPESVSTGTGADAPEMRLFRRPSDRWPRRCTW